MYVRKGDGAHGNALTIRRGPSNCLARLLLEMPVDSRAP